MRTSSSAAIGLVARRVRRVRWSSHIALTVTVGAAAAVVVALLVGAQRADSALDRLRGETRASDVSAFPDREEDVEALLAMAGTDGVVSAGLSREMFVRPAGSALFPNFQLLALAPSPEAADEVNTPVIVTGRAPASGALDEVALSEGLAADLGLDVGDRFDLESMSSAWVEESFNGADPGPPDGPVVTVEVVGLARTPADFGRWAGVIHLTTAFATRYEAEIRTYTYVEVRLTDDLAERTRSGESVELSGFETSEVQPSYFASSHATQDGLRTISAGLQLAAGVSALAGLVATTLMTSRMARDTLADRPILEAIGWTRVELAQLVIRVLGPWVFVGAVAGLVVGALASPLASMGLAEAVDPAGDTVIVQAGWLTVLAGAAASIPLAVVVLAAVRASRTNRGRSVKGWALPPLRRPLVLSLGLRRALFGAADQGGRASRGAAAAAAGSVALATAALLVGASIHRLQDDPALSGQGPRDQRGIDAGEDGGLYDRALAALDHDDRVSDLTGFHVFFGLHAPGVDELTALVHEVRRGEPGAAVVHGRPAAQPDEVAVGPATLEDLGLAVGDEVELAAFDEVARFRIVGVVLFPEGDFGHDSGVAMTVSGGARLSTANDLHFVAFSWRDEVDPAAADRSLQELGFRVLTTDEGLVPAVVSNLGEIRSLPLLLAALVVALGLVALLHAVSLATRTRDRQAGTLRALGMARRSLGAVVVTHGFTVALGAAVIGVPLGVTVGRPVWSMIATRANVLDHPIVPWGGTARVAAVLLIGTAVLTLPIAAQSMRPRVSSVLRTE